MHSQALGLFRHLRQSVGYAPQPFGSEVEVVFARDDGVIAGAGEKTANIVTDWIWLFFWIRLEWPGFLEVTRLRIQLPEVALRIPLAVNAGLECNSEVVAHPHQDVVSFLALLDPVQELLCGRIGRTYVVFANVA